MANNHDRFLSDAEWQALGQEACECEVEIYVIRKDKVALLVQRDLPVPSPYVAGLLAALLDLPKAGVTKVSIYCDGDKFP